MILLLELLFTEILVPESPLSPFVVSPLSPFVESPLSPLSPFPALVPSCPFSPFAAAGDVAATHCDELPSL